MDEVGNNRDKLEFNNLHEDSEELYGKNLTFERYTAVNKQLGSKAWLGLYGLKRNNIDKLSVLQNIGFLVKEGYYHCLGKYVKSCYGDNLFVRVRNDQTGDVYNVTAKRGYIKELKLRVSRAVELYRDRLTWLTSGSRSIFGVLQEHSAIFLIDIKTQSPEIFSRFIKSLEYLVTDQLKKMKLFNMIRCQDEPFVFSNELVAVDDCSLRNVLQWVTELKRLTFFSANCTAECISSINQLTKCFEAIYLITEGESSMISPGILENVVKTLKHPLHIVSYGCENMHSIEYLHSLCTNTGGRFHAYCINMQIPLYSPSCWDVEKFQQMIEVNKIEYGGPPKGWGQHEDCVLIFQELEEARSILQRIEQILHDIDCMPNQGNQDSSLKSCQPAPLTNTSKLDWKREEDMSSKEWLSIHGLKAQHLDFYDSLASVSFKHCDGVVNVLIPPLDNVLDNKNVFTSSSTSNNDIHKVYEKIYDNSMIDHQSEPNLKTSSQIWSSHAIVQPKLINAQYCSNFVHVLWKDNTIVHVQVTPELYRLYHQRMQSRLNAIQQRLNMLRKGSRELFGTITEDDVYILIDTSTSMLSCIEFVKEKLLQLLYDQLKYKNHWNLIAFNSTINAWSNHLQSTTEQNLKSAIKWIEKLNCGGSTNTLKALQFALEDNLTQGIYLLTDGRPDEEPQTLLLSMQLNHRLPIHTISFNCNDPEANEFLIQLAQETGGRFHYYNEFPNDNNKPQQWESEDIRLLEKEYQLGLDNLEKLAQIRDECYLLRMKSTKSIKGVQSKTYQLKSLQNKLPSSDVTNSDKGSIVSFKQNQCKRSYSSHQSTYNDHNINNKTKAKLIHCSTVLFNQSKTINSKKSTIRKWQPIEKLSNDPYYPNLQSLCANVDSGNDFVLYETKQLLDRQSQRYNEAKREEISAHKTKKAADGTEKSGTIYTIPEWLSHHSLTAKQLRFNDLLKSFTVPLRPTYIPALGHHVVSEVLKQTLPIAYVSRTKLLKCPEIRLFNPLAINFEQYEKNLRNALFTIEKKLIEIIFQYLNNESLNSLCKDVHLDKYKKWRSKLCWYQDYKCIIKTFEKLNWPFPQHELILLTNELDAGQKYLEQVKNLKKQSCRSSIKCDNILTTRYAPCGHPYRVLSVNK